MSTTVFPESGDQITEAAWTTQNQALTVAERYRVSGYTLSAGTGLNADVAAGTCVVNGYHIVSDATQAVAVTASQTNYLWLNEDGTLSANTTGTNPGSELLLGTATTDGSGVTAVSHTYNIANSQNVLIIKPSDETVNNSATFQNDDDFQFAVSSGDQWEIRTILIIDNPDSTADFKLQWNISGGTLTDYTTIEAEIQSSGFHSSSDGTINYGGSTTGRVAIVDSIIFVATGGTLALQWAQGAAFAGNTVVNANSVLIARRIIG